MSDENGESRSPGVWYPDDVEKGKNLDQTIGMRTRMIGLLLGSLVLIATMAFFVWDIYDLIRIFL